MNPFWLYPIHLAAFAAGVALLILLKRQGLPGPARAAIGIAACAALAVFSYQISDPPKAVEFNDFKQAYYPAAKSLFSHDSEAGLSASFGRGAEGFVNLPILAYLFAPLAVLPRDAAAYGLFFFGIAATIGLWHLLCRLAALDLDRSLLLLLFIAANGPLHYSLRIGNTTHVVLLLVVLGLLAMRRDRDFLAGLLIGLAALIKLPLLLLGMYFLARGRWRVAVGGATMCAAAGLLSLAVFGWDLHVHWYENSIKPFAGKPLSAYNNQSIQAFFARLDHGTSYLLNWKIKPVHPMLLLASKVAVFSLLGTVAAVIFWPPHLRRGKILETPASKIIEIEVSVVMLLAIIISTISWSHYHLWMLLPAALFIGRRLPALDASWLRLLAWAAFIAALPPVLTVKTGIPPVLARPFSYLLISHYLIGALLLLGLLLWSDWRARSSPAKD
jgi:alpha-1,2-mannosyltransferase